MLALGLSIDHQSNSCNPPKPDIYLEVMPSQRSQNLLITWLCQHETEKYVCRFEHCDVIFPFLMHLDNRVPQVAISLSLKGSKFQLVQVSDKSQSDEIVPDLTGSQTRSVSHVFHDNPYANGELKFCLAIGWHLLFDRSSNLGFLELVFHLDK